MIGRNQQALALAFRKCKGKILKIKELGITPKMKEKDIDKLIELLAEVKAKQKVVDISETVAGQRWYVENLVTFSGLSTTEQLDVEYDDAFADTASEGEMLKALQSL